MMVNSDPPPASALHRALARDILERLRAPDGGTGRKLSRLALANELGVSRTPVLRALALLEVAGAIAIEGRTVVLRDAGFDPARLGPPRAEDEEAVGHLIRDIARDRSAGALPDEVSERQLLARYAVPRAHLAGALRHLAAVGAVARNRGHGWQFTRGYASAEDRQAAYRFRLMIEPAGLLEPRFALPEGWAPQMRTRHAVFLGEDGAVDPVAFFETNAAFHHGLAEASGNRFLAQAVEQQNQLRRFFNYDWRRGGGRVRVLAAEHLAILDAIEAGNLAEAAERMRRHLAGSLALPWQERIPVDHGRPPAG